MCCRIPGVSAAAGEVRLPHGEHRELRGDVGLHGGARLQLPLATHPRLQPRPALPRGGRRQLRPGRGTRPQCSDVVFVHSEDQKCGLSDCPDFQGGCDNRQFLIFEHLHSQLAGPKTKTCLLTHPSIQGFASVNPDEGLSNFAGHIWFEWNILHCKLHVARRSFVFILLHPRNKKQVNLRTGDNVRGTIQT